jgi:hypothetical protein
VRRGEPVVIGISDILPGEKEAAEEFSREQVLAFAGIEPDISGISVRPFTPRMFVDLEIGKNALFGHGPLTPQSVAVFLWRISFAYERGNQEKRTQFLSFVAYLPWEETVEECLAYVSRAWLATPDWPSGTGPKSAGVWPARLVHMFASEYGWGEDYILDLPFRRLWQYANRVLEAHSPKYVQKAPGVRKARADWLKKENARIKAGKK